MIQILETVNLKTLHIYLNVKTLYFLKIGEEDYCLVKNQLK